MPQSELIVSVSGIRGIVGQSLAPDSILRFGQAFGRLLQENQAIAGNTRPLRAVLGRDSRVSGPMVACALAAGLLSVGVNVTDLGVVTTPSVGLMTRFLTADAGIVITASHNPPEYNGIKFLRADGVGFPPTVIERLKALYASGNWKPADVDHVGSLSSDSRSHAHHVQTVLQHVDAKPIASHRYRIVLDSINGAGCIASPMLLGKLGAELVHINGEATGKFAHTPEPIRENLLDLCRVVIEKKADIGFAQDPDADRLVVVDETGRFIGEEYTLAMAVLNRLMSRPGTVVCNLSTSRMIDDIARRFDSPVLRTAVGEANVAARMLQENAIIGGEGNGGVIDLRVGPVRDSLMGMASILELMTRTGKKVSELVASLPAYAMIKSKFACTRQQADQLVEKVKAAYSTQQLDLQDGVRIDWPEGWVQVRPSNTEPIARVIAEAADDATARELIFRIERLRLQLP